MSKCVEILKGKQGIIGNPGEQGHQGLPNQGFVLGYSYIYFTITASILPGGINPWNGSGPVLLILDQVLLLIQLAYFQLNIVYFLIVLYQFL